MDLNDVAIFVKVVEAGSFTRAAKLLEAPKSTVSAKVAALERQLGVTLLHRTTRRLSTTAEGAAFFQASVTALTEIEAAGAMVSTRQRTPRGRIVITVPNPVGERFMPVFLKRFLKKYPEIAIVMSVTNRYVDLIGEGIDLAVRAGNLADSSLITRRVGLDQRGLFAAPAYLNRTNRIKVPADLKNHECVRWGSESDDVWRLKRDTKSAAVRIGGHVTADDLTTVKELAAHGHGVALLPIFFAHDDVVKGRLVRILPEWNAGGVPIALVYPAQRYLQTRMRVFIDEFAAAMREEYFP